MNSNQSYLSESNRNNTFYIQKGQVMAGYTIGILLLDVWYPLLPGNVVNASTFNFPVRHKQISNATQERIHNGDPSLIENIIAAGRELERDGVRAVCGACGYLGNYQEELRESLTIPVFLSSLLQLPLMAAGLGKKQKIGIICADKSSLTSKLLIKCGMKDIEKCVVEGIGDKPEFSSILNSDRGYFNNKRIRNEVLETSKKMIAKNKEIGAILLECSDLPPYSADIQKETGLPVFDFITLINFVHQSVAQTEYYGFI